MSGQLLTRIRGTQIGLRDADLIDRLKRDMVAGRFAYQETQGRIGGVRDRHGRYHVIEGHHRMVAAVELFRETGDETAVRNLIQWGMWTDQDSPPSDSRPLPSRHWWGAFRNWLGL
jgi:filamentous hemagglutinin